MSILDMPREARLPRLGSVTDRDVLDKARRYERALATWQSDARGFRRTTTALQAASDDLIRVAETLRNSGSLPPDEAEQLALLRGAIARLDRHLAQFD